MQKHTHASANGNIKIGLSLFFIERKPYIFVLPKHGFALANGGQGESFPCGSLRAKSSKVLRFFGKSDKKRQQCRNTAAIFFDYADAVALEGREEWV